MVRNTLSMIIAAVASIVLFTVGTTVAQDGSEYGGQTQGGGEYGTEQRDTSTDKLSFDSLDMDGDMQLTREEFITGMYDAWDKDGNDTIDQQEWDKAVEKYGISEQYAEIPNPEGVDRQGYMDWAETAGLYESWDIDGDGVITEQEFETAKEQMPEGTADEQEEMGGEQEGGVDEEADTSDEGIF